MSFSALVCSRRRKASRVGTTLSKCSAIVVSYKTGPTLERCLTALQQVRSVGEIIVVDNGNFELEEASLDAIASADPRFRILRGHGNVGFAAGCNLGARSVSGDVLCFVNPDVLLKSDAIERLLSALQAIEGPAIIGGDLRDAQGRPDRGSRRERLTLWRALVYSSGLARLEALSPVFRDFNRHKEPVPQTPTPTGAVSGALMLIRRMDFDALGGFDEGYFLHFEDVDLCRRGEDLGWPVLFVPGPHGVHVRSTSHVSKRVMAAHKARGMARYLSKFADNQLERMLNRTAAASLLFASSCAPLR